MTIKFTYQELIAEAQKYSSKEDFKKNSPEAYKRALNKRILHKITSHMDKGQISWTSDQILEEANKYTNEKEFEKGSFKAYQAAIRKDLLKEISIHWNHTAKRTQEIRAQEPVTSKVKTKHTYKHKEEQDHDSFNRDINGRQILTRPYKSYEEVPHWLYALLTVGGIYLGGIPALFVVVAWLFHASKISSAKEEYKKNAELWNAMYPDDKVNPYID